MPNLMTHKIFGEDVLKVSNEKVQYYVQNSPQAFSVGTSGPDFLFYHSQFPWQNQDEGKRVRKTGSLVHSQKINDWYKIAVESCIKEEDVELRQRMISFMIGHICHWALDSIAHPFIFYRTDGSSKETKYWHFRYESMLDTVMVNNYRKTSIKDYPSREILKTDKEIRMAIYQVYRKAVEETYTVKFKYNDVKKSFKDADKVLSILYDPSGRKFFTIQLLERLIRKKWIFSSHIVTDKVKDEEDVLNLNNRTWKNPAKPSIESNESFLDLYYKAIDLAKKALFEFVLALESGDTSSFLKVVNNRSYETGLSEYKVMTEFKSVY